MRLAILDDEPAFLEVLADLLHPFKPDLYDSTKAFKNSSYAGYDLILVDHSIDEGWYQFYIETCARTKADYGVMTTFPRNHYGEIFPRTPDRVTRFFGKEHLNDILTWVQWTAYKKETLEMVSARG